MSHQTFDHVSAISRSRRIAHLAHGTGPRAGCPLCYAAWRLEREAVPRPPRIAEPVARPIPA